MRRRARIRDNLDRAPLGCESRGFPAARWSPVLRLLEAAFPGAWQRQVRCDTFRVSSARARRPRLPMTTQDEWSDHAPGADMRESKGCLRAELGGNRRRADVT